MKPNIYECKICHEHHCEHDFQMQEDELNLFPLNLQPPPPKKNSRSTENININGTIDNQNEKSSDDDVSSDLATSSKSQDAK